MVLGARDEEAKDRCMVAVLLKIQELENLDGFFSLISLNSGKEWDSN